MSSILHFILITILLFQFHFAFATTSNPSGLSIRATVDTSPQSPLYQIENLTLVERFERLTKITNARVDYLASISRPNATLVPDNFRIGIYREGLFYEVGFTIGSRQHAVRLLLDTGGGLAWTQCQPCQRCFPQRLPIYDPRASSTYGVLPCSHYLCQGPSKLYNCVNNLCMYSLVYGSGATTVGVASREKFHFLISNNSTRSFDVIFGCSLQSANFPYENTDISGVFGLNNSPDSMAYQFAPLIQSRFSYCFVPFRDAMPRPLVLRFGEDVPQRANLKTISLMTVPLRPYFYYLELLDISVGNHRIGFPQGTFRIRRDGSGGLSIDSGTLVSAIETNTIGINAYEAVMAVFNAYYRSKGLQRAHGVMGLEYCYAALPNYRDYLSMTFHFNGADYTVPGEYGHFFGDRAFCVAIIKSLSGSSLLGAWQQQNKRIIYNKLRGVLQFADEQCINDVL